MRAFHFVTSITKKEYSIPKEANQKSQSGLEPLPRGSQQLGLLAQADNPPQLISLAVSDIKKIRPMFAIGLYFWFFIINSEFLFDANGHLPYSLTSNQRAAYSNLAGALLFPLTSCIALTYKNVYYIFTLNIRRNRVQSSSDLRIDSSVIRSPPISFL